MVKIYTLFVHINNVIEKVCMFIVMCLMALMTCIVAYQVFMRTVISKPTGWTEEASLDALTWAVFLMAPIIYRHKDFLNLDVLYSRFSPLIQRISDWIFFVLETIILCIMFYFSIKFTKSGAMSFSATLPSITMDVIYMALPIGFGGMLLICCERFFGFFANTSKNSNKVAHLKANLEGEF